MLEDLLRDRVTLVKKNGTVFKEDINSIVTRGKVQIHDTSLPIEVGDHLLRRLPNALVEDYVVTDPVLQAGLGDIKAFYIVHVERSGQSPTNQTAVVQSITNNFHGGNSQVNIASTNNSINVVEGLDMDRLQSFVKQIRPAIGALPPITQSEIIAPLEVLEEEIQSSSPSSSKIALALQSIKTVAEGAAGNLVASGITALISSLLV